MTTPVVNTRPTPEQPPRKKTKTTPPRAISPEVARRRMTTPVVAPRSGLNPPPLTLSCHPLPWSTHARHRSNPQEKNNIVIPESPAPAGSHALISRTPTPGGMLHANLGLPRPPPRNFQPPLPQRLPVQPQKNPPIPLTPRAAAPAAACVAGRSRGQHMLPQQPSKQTATAPPLNLCRSQAPGRVKESPNPPNPSCCRSRGGMRGWPLPRPTHAPATTLKTNGNSAPIKPMSFPSSASESVPPSSASPTTPPGNNPQNKRSPRRAQHKKRASKGAQNPPPRRHPARKITAQFKFIRSTLKIIGAPSGGVISISTIFWALLLGAVAPALPFI